MTMPAVAVPRSYEIPPGLLALRPAALMRSYTRQPLSFWALTSYLFFEYVRPQSAYPIIDFLPWAQLSLIVAVLSAAAMELGKRRWTMIDTGMVLFTGIILASLLTAFDVQRGIENLDVWVGWILAFFIISTVLNTPTRFLLALLPWLLWNLKMSLFAFRSWASIGFGFRTWGVSGAPGWFGNSGEFGIEMCVFFPISLYLALGLRKHVPKWVFYGLLVMPATALTGAISSSSRGAVVGLAAVGLWMFLRGRHRLRGLFALAALATIGYFVIPEQQKERFSSMGEDGTSVSRLTYWERGIEFANEHPVLGIGYKGWFPYYTYRWGNQLGPGEQVQLPHNFMIEAVSELGYTGLVTLLFLLFGNFWLNYKTRAMAKRLGTTGDLLRHLATGLDGSLIGFIVAGSFVTVLFYPYIWVNLGMSVALYRSSVRAIRSARPAHVSIPEAVIPRAGHRGVIR